MVAAPTDIRAACPPPDMETIGVRRTPDVRAARPSDLPAIVDLQRLSLRVLGAGYYTGEQIESAIEFLPMMEQQLIVNRTYYVAEIDGQLVGCGGWSTRTPAYQRGNGVQSLVRGIPKVRAMYVHPQFARRGIGGALLEAIEHALVAAGHKEAGMDATLGGMPLYRKCGYRPVACVHAQFVNGVCLPMVFMRKSLVRDEVGGAQR